MKLKTLSPSEKSVIIDKGTERPYSGKYDANFAPGIYCCKQCDTALFTSQSKFQSHCGWPSFDDAIKERVFQQSDADGRRTEIICAHCQGHLGHVFEGEHITEKNTRHCVNSISLQFYPIDELFDLALHNDERYGAIVVAGGCFWGVEHLLKMEAGVLITQVGYTGGHVNKPDYHSVCSGTTHHAEALRIIFDKTQTDSEQLLKVFFEIHDPSQLNRQGPDLGNQYRSAIFYVNNEQKKIAESLIQQLQLLGYEVVTQVEKFKHFWPAEDYHQNYYEKKRGAPYCHARVKRFKSKLREDQ